MLVPFTSEATAGASDHADLSGPPVPPASASSSADSDAAPSPCARSRLWQSHSKTLSAAL